MTRKRRTVVTRFGLHLRELLVERGISYRTLAARTHYGRSTLHEVATGGRVPSLELAQRVDKALGAGGELAALAREPGARRAGISARSVLAACACPFRTLGEACSAADLIAAAGWIVRRHNPPVPLDILPGVLVVAAVYAAVGIPIGTISYRSAGEGLRRTAPGVYL